MARVFDPMDKGVNEARYGEWKEKLDAMWAAEVKQKAEASIGSVLEIVADIKSSGGYFLNGKRISSVKAEKIFGNDLENYIFLAAQGKEENLTDKGTLKIVRDAPPLIRSGFFDTTFDFAPNINWREHKRRIAQLVPTAMFELDGKMIGQEEAEDLFGLEIKTAANEVAEALLVSPKSAEKKIFDTDYGPLRIMFLGMKK